MSKEHIEIITCPKCGRKKEFTVWDSLNGDIDPYAKEQLLNGSLFKHKCSECGFEANVIYNILYHDMSHNTMVYFVQPEAFEDAKKAMMLAEKTSAEQMKNLGFPPHKTRQRIVTDQNKLREKAIIFEHELDDRIIEIIKLLSFAEIYKDHKEIDLFKTYFLVNNGKHMLEFCGEKQFAVTLPDGMYDEFKNVFYDKINKFGEDYSIDTAWAMKFISNKDI